MKNYGLLVKINKKCLSTGNNKNTATFSVHFVLLKALSNQYRMNQFVGRLLSQF